VSMVHWPSLGALMAGVTSSDLLIVPRCIKISILVTRKNEIKNFSGALNWIKLIAHSE
jgi:hypothetical protein